MHHASSSRPKLMYRKPVLVTVDCGGGGTGVVSESLKNEVSRSEIESLLSTTVILMLP